MRKRIFITLLSAAVLLLAACGQASDKKPNAGGADIANGNAQIETLYKNNCLSCHGANLEGLVGPTTNLQKVGERLSKEQIVNQITNGNKNMMGFKGKLTDEEIDILASWLAEKK